MDDKQTLQLIRQAFDDGAGVFRLMPTWIPLSFCVPGRRLRLHPADLYALGAHRGGIDERWFASTITINNPPYAPADEGLSYIHMSDGQKVTLRDAVGLMGDDVLGADVMARDGGWVMYAKFFDNMTPLPFHLHQTDALAALVGQLGKPEAYYFPPQYNAALNTYPYTFFGFHPDITRDQVIDCLKRWGEGDNGILELSRAYRLALGTGWDVPAGVLHAPGTLCTYEPQRASAVFSMWQSLVGDDQVVPWDLLVKDVPADKHHDFDFLLSLLDWEANTDPHFARRNFTAPVLVDDLDTMRGQGYEDRWIVYGSEWFSAKELLVLPGRTVTISDPVAYGLICIQGRGRFGKFRMAAPNMIHFGEMTEDEFFVTRGAALRGVTITNESAFEPLVILKHFNPGHPDMPSRA